MLYWAQNQNAFIVGAWWWYVPPGLSVAVLGMGLVLLNFGLDELGNPRLRDAAHRRDRRAPLAAIGPDAGRARGSPFSRRVRPSPGDVVACGGR